MFDFYVLCRRVCLQNHTKRITELKCTCLMSSKSEIQQKPLMLVCKPCFYLRRDYFHASCHFCIASVLRPLCIHTASLLHPCCVHAASLLCQCCISPASYLCSICIPSTSFLLLFFVVIGCNYGKRRLIWHIKLLITPLIDRVSCCILVPI